MPLILDCSRGAGHFGRFAIAALMTLATTPSGASGSGSVDGAVVRVEDLELLGRWEVPGAATDVRWAGRDSVLLATSGEGVAERRMVEELPVVRNVFPRDWKLGRWVEPINLAASGSRLLLTNVDDRLAWMDTSAPDAAPPEVRKRRGYFDDADVRGDTVVLLGYPTAQLFGENDQAFLWLGDLRDRLERWTALTALREDRGDLYTTPGIATMRLRLGSVRILDDGDLLVVPGFKPGVHRFSPSGKQRAYWSPEELEASLFDAVGLERPETAGEPLPLAAGPQRTEWDSRFLASQRFVIEDAISLGDEGAIVVRHGSGKGARYFLGVLGAEVRWYGLPVKARESIDRIRADYSQVRDRLVVLIGPRPGRRDGASDLFLVAAP
jgi:hypothetical protein